MKPTAAQTQFIERVGRWWESITGSRVAGQILGWLMICDPPHQSAAELMDAVHTSAGSISTQTRFLEQMSLVERISFRGDRATYYQLKENAWEHMMATEMNAIREWDQLAMAATDLVPAERPDRVTDLSKMTSFLLVKWPEVMVELREHIQKEELD